jgi:hypothetical protein
MTPMKTAFRPTQQTPAEIVEDLMQVIRVGFYQEIPKKWFKDQRFLKVNVVLWPAGWLNKKGVTLPPERYKEILQKLFIEIKVNATQAIKYPPGYLMHSVQKHFAIHGDEYYEEAKSMRAKTDNALFGVQRARDTVRGADPVQAMAMSQSVLSVGTKRRSVGSVKRKQQLDLL